MEQNLKVFHNVMDSEYSDLYISAWEEYPQLDFGISLDKLMNSSLQNTEKSSLALRLLNSTKEEESWKKPHLWISRLLKLYASCKDNRKAHQFLTAIGVVAKLSSVSRETKRFFGTTHVNNIYQVISKEYAIPIDKMGVLQCMKVLLELYPEYSMQAEVVIKAYLLKLIDSQRSDAVEYTAKCLHLLLCISKNRPKNSTPKSLWAEYQNMLCESLQVLLDHYLARENSSVINAMGNESLRIPSMSLSEDPIKRLPQIFIRFKNIAVYLIVTLREPYSTEKYINPNKFLNFIKQALEDISTVSENISSYYIIFAMLLPQLYYVLLQILETVIITLGRNLRKNYKQIWTILGNLLNLSSTKVFMEHKKSYMHLRIKLCDVISLWCGIAAQGSRSDLMNNFIVKGISDLSNAYRILLQHDDQTMREVIKSTQRSLYDILMASPNCVKHQHAQAIEIELMNCFVLMRDSALANNVQNAHIQDLLQGLFALLTAKMCITSSSAEFLINITRDIHLADARNQLTDKSALMYMFFENCLHPQKDSFKYQIEVRHVQSGLLDSFAAKPLQLPKPYSRTEEKSRSEESCIVVDEPMDTSAVENEATNTQSDLEVLTSSDTDDVIDDSPEKDHEEPLSKDTSDDIEISPLKSHEEPLSKDTSDNIDISPVKNHEKPLSKVTSDDIDISPVKSHEEPLSKDASDNSDLKNVATSNPNDDLLVEDIITDFVDDLN